VRATSLEAERRSFRACLVRDDKVESEFSARIESASITVRSIQNIMSHISSMATVPIRTRQSSSTTRYPKIPIKRGRR